MNLPYRKLTSSEMTFLKTHFEVLLFERKHILLSEAQLPLIGFVLISGSVNLIKKRTVLYNLGPNELLGVMCLLNNEPLPYSFEIEAQSKILIIPKSGISKIECLLRSL